MDRRGRSVHRSPDMAGNSEVRPNVTPYYSDNATTWVIPGSDSYSFGMGGSMNFVEKKPISMIYKVDGIHLKGRLGDTMFVATAQDRNKHVYPIAFGYGNCENNLSWEWFLDCLKGFLGHIDDLVFISIRHARIEIEISKVFPHTTHTICYWHFSENIKKRFRRKDVTAIMDKEAISYIELKYNRHMK
ncbi:hypothetical protein Ddye_016350 [Dipteronia dyeriana]|uniref:MULE transposase domain-containing protein n=1 Tax=Dipteronia dyeriana TaxID=168575 RepID=A0AAD9U792_9ROSI|nr:hypothetical protein Ddye_016350 [Dipteronia dyeriana]